MKKTLMLIIALFLIQPTLAAQAAIENIVIDVVGTLVQDLRAGKDAETARPSDKLKIAGSYYALYPGARQAIEAFEKDDKLKVYFFASEEEVPLAQMILNAFDHREDRLITAPDAKWLAKNTIRFTHQKDAKSDKFMTVVAPVGEMYYFKTFAQSEAARSDAESETLKYFAKSESEWSLSYHRFEFFYLTVLSVNRGTVAIQSMKAAILAANQPNSSMLNFITKWSAESYQTKVVKLESSKGQIRACRISSYDPTTLKVVDKTESITADSECLKNSGESRYAWMDKSKQRCGQFIGKLYFRSAAILDCATTKRIAKFSGEKYSFTGGATDFSLAQLNKAPQVMSGVSFPRLEAPLFRGLSQCHYHFKPAQTIKSWFSIAPYTMNSKLMSKWISELGSLDVVVDKYADYFSKQDVTLLKQAYTAPTSGLYQNFPQDALYATLYYDIAKYYTGSQFGCDRSNGMVVAIHDYDKRGVDLNYVMGSRGERNNDIDAGEYLMPLLVDETEMDGLIFPSTHHAYFQVSEFGKTYVLVYQNVDCIFKDASNGRIYKCANFEKPFVRGHQDFPIHGPPARPIELAIASAVMVSCSAKETCSIPQGFEERHRVKLADEFALEIDPSELSGNDITVKAIFKK